LLQIHHAFRILLHLLVTDIVIPGYLKMEALRSYEMSVLTRVTQPHIPEDDILHSNCRENLKSYKFESQ
jgi:hypothetical protein